MPEKELSTKEKGQLMIEWAQKVQCPKEVRLNDYTLIEDTTKFLATQVATMKAQDAGTRIWILAYLRIYELKKVLVNNKANKK